MTNYPTKPILVTMFYDGNCSICRREVTHYKSIDGNKCVNWIDFSHNPEQLQDYGIDYEAAMSSLHVLDKEGHMQTGVQAFLAIWSTLPYYRVLAKLIKTLRIAPVLEWLYKGFARWRLRRQNSLNCQKGRS